MSIEKSKGVTDTERLLARLCDSTFLKLWAYPNPYNDKKVELCDLLAVFENHVFIFFDRESLILNNKDKDPVVNWKRWKKKVIDAQIKTAIGAENYIRKSRPIFLDQANKTEFPINIDSEDLIIHKIIIAHGAEDACKNSSQDNISGSLAITYGDEDGEVPFPFFLDLNRDDPVHVFDSCNLPIILSELDTFYDFTAYLDAKIEAIKRHQLLSYCGEEDLLAHYFMNFDELKNQHYIGELEGEFSGVHIGEGEWEYFVQRIEYKDRKEADKGSYLWDEVIQRTCEFTLDGSIQGINPLGGKSAVHEMAKEPRFIRRMLSKHMKQSIKNFPESSDPIVRSVAFMPSFYKGKAYVFLQLKVQGFPDTEKEYREKRQGTIEIACGAAKNKFSHLHTIVGIAIDAPKYAKRNSEDFLLMDCTDWPESKRASYDEANEGWNFFQTKNLTLSKKNASEFPNPESNEKSNRTKIGRNEPCPCGSGKKYKKCCIGIRIK